MPNSQKVVDIAAAITKPDQITLNISFAEATLIIQALTNLGTHYSVLSDKLNLDSLDSKAKAYFILAMRLAKDTGWESMFPGVHDPEET